MSTNTATNGILRIPTSHPQTQTKKTKTEPKSHHRRSSAFFARTFDAAAAQVLSEIALETSVSERRDVVYDGLGVR